MTEQQKKKLYIGRHVNTMYGFVSSVDHAHKNGMTFFQIFLSNPKAYNGPRHPEDQLKEIKKNIDSKGMKFVVHANYMLNFCNDPKDSKHNGAIKLLTSDLNECVKCGAIGVVIHMGKQLTMDKDTALKNYVDGVKKCLDKTKDSGAIIILETGAGQGTEICTSIMDLGDLYNKFTKEEKKRLGFCLDTCHMFAAGYDLNDPDYVKFMSRMIDIHLGWGNIMCIHFNDSKCPVNCRKDKHADIGQGFIGEDGLKEFALECFKRDIPIVLETPSDSGFHSNEQIKLVKKWHREWLNPPADIDKNTDKKMKIPLNIFIQSTIDTNPPDGH